MTRAIIAATVLVMVLHMTTVKSFDGFQCSAMILPYNETAKIIYIRIHWWNPDADPSSHFVVYRNGLPQNLGPKSGLISYGGYGLLFQYVAHKDGVSYTYEVCEVETGECSIPATVVID